MKKRMWHLRMMLGALVVVAIVLFCGCNNKKTTIFETENLQRIHHVMLAAPQGGRSIVNYTRYLNVGDTVTGSVMMTEAQPEFIDWSTPWTFEAQAPDGSMLDSATIIYEADPYHAFNFVAATAGEYTLRAAHSSLSNRDLDITINPSGWQLKDILVK